LGRRLLQRSLWQGPDRIYDVGMKLSDRRVAAFFSLVLASGLCLALLMVRVRYPHGSEYRFLAWNLCLAWIPFLLAVALHDSARRGHRAAFLAVLGGAWLLFLPNAPYIVTDFVHVGRVSGVPIWYDAGMTASFAALGLVLGLGSVLLVQGVVERHLGAVVGWLMLVPIFGLCSAGMYIGRVHRLNSWDAITSPGSLLHAFSARLADPFARPETIVALVGAMGLLMVAYLVLYTVSDLRPDHNRSSRPK
jgi:uncharacterized membrane protein